MAFHGTLQRWGQVLDEVPMLWSSLIFLWIGVCNALSPTAEKQWSNLLAIVLSVFGTASTVVYFQGGFIYFITTYTLTVVSIFGG